MDSSNKMLLAAATLTLATLGGTKLHVMHVMDKADKNVAAHRYTLCAAWLSASNAETPSEKNMLIEYTKASIRLNPDYFAEDFNRAILNKKKEIAQSNSSVSMLEEMKRCEVLFTKENNY